MKKIYTIEDLGCASCASKMEDAIGKLEGVNKVAITFMTKKLVIDAEDGQFDEIIKQAGRIIKKIEPDAELRPYRR
ncbi:cation transporter [Anaerobium acetethylicum]|uniref:Heavy-metal-associated domain-containing protein n=1 Tax=Anaerobium acetethylicum TaxID=1619234 RepID=A0A1D3TW04_9FIRM|nr:cation transporter [Anaerobium acetethylicum]SCP98328.1 Heavy-metal-associated domain-containing protein [Anaerobium acetethylicum]